MGNARAILIATSEGLKAILTEGTGYVLEG
jgi:hypothetical protein